MKIFAASNERRFIYHIDILTLPSSRYDGIQSDENLEEKATIVREKLARILPSIYHGERDHKRSFVRDISKIHSRNTAEKWRVITRRLSTRISLKAKDFPGERGSLTEVGSMCDIAASRERERERGIVEGDRAVGGETRLI